MRGRKHQLKRETWWELISLKVEVGSVRLSRAGVKVPEMPATDALYRGLETKELDS